MLLILPIILLRISFKVYILFLNYSLKQLQYPTYYVHNITFITLIVQE